MTKIIDLSMTVSADMMVFPRLACPMLAMLESWEDLRPTSARPNMGPPG
jgi:hypothetical protein